MGMVNAGEAIPKLRLRLPPFQALKATLKGCNLKKQSQFTGRPNGRNYL
jgi:hypothetical protein